MLVREMFISPTLSLASGEGTEIVHYSSISVRRQPGQHADSMQMYSPA